MTRPVDYGIDLGTTNSAISRMTRRGPEIVKDRYELDITPSAVGMNSQGSVIVGKDAFDKPEFQAVQGFKRDMGSDRTFKMRDGSERTPVELSAEVLKELKAAVAMRFDANLTHAVITVPAMFMQPQVEATHQAALAAGITAVALLQEPIAAATAYLNDDPVEGKYLVYDLGGGTFDVSVIELKGGEMRVIGHGGDNYLGGRDFDDKIAEWVLAQLRRQGHDVSELSPAARFTLLRECVRVKKALSQQEQSTMDLSDVGTGLPQITISQQVLNDLIEDLIDRTIVLAKERIEDCGLAPSDIRSVLLVGGPTKTPYVRERLKADLGISLNLELDPMTVVARGAAITASTMLVSDDTDESTARAPGTAQFDLTYEPVVNGRSCPLAGKLKTLDIDVAEVRVSRGSDWDTGWIALRNGAFVTELTIGVAPVTEFQLTCRSSKGDMIEMLPGLIAVRSGIAPAQGVAPYNYGVALAGGESMWVLKEGQPLPHFGDAKPKAAHGVLANSPQELHIYFLEGRSRSAEECMGVGHLVIRGTDIARSVSKGDTVEVKMKMDESRRIATRVFLPLHDAEFAIDLFSSLDAPDPVDVRAQIERADGTLHQLKEVVSQDELDVVARLQSDSERVDAELVDVERGEPGSKERVGKRLSDLNAEVSRLKSKYEVEMLYREAIDSIDRAEQIAESAGDQYDAAACREMRNDADKAKRLDDDKSLSDIDKKANEVFWRYYRKSRECWLGWTIWMRDRAHLAKDPSAYMTFVQRAEQAAMADDLQAAQVNVSQAMDLLPEREIQAGRFDRAGLMRS